MKEYPYIMDVGVFCMFFGSESHVEKAFWMSGGNFEQRQAGGKERFGGEIHMGEDIFRTVLRLEKTMPTLHTLANYKFLARGSP